MKVIQLNDELDITDIFAILQCCKIKDPKDIYYEYRKELNGAIGYILIKDNFKWNLISLSHGSNGLELEAFNESIISEYHDLDDITVDSVWSTKSDEFKSLVKNLIERAKDGDRT